MYVVIFVLLSIAPYEVLPQDICRDEYAWCSSLEQQLNMCDNAAMQSICKETCNLCPNKNCNACEHMCDPLSRKCSCRAGYRLRADQKTCADIDECRELIHPCNATHTSCNNYIGGYSCLRTRDACVNERGTTNYYKQETCCKQSSAISGFGKCGLNSANTGRIVGGVESIIGQWPWMVYVRVADQLCGGSLINEKWIVTAAHCFGGFSMSRLSEVKVIAGLRNTTDENEPSRQVLTVKRYILHDRYNYPDYDIALIELRNSVKWGLYVGPICLPNGERPRVGDKCFATGYGTTSFNGEVAMLLQEVDLPITEPGACKKKYERELTKVDPSIMLCAGYEEGGKDACQGDSGGPLMCQRCDSCDFYLAGVTSFGKGCGYPGQYGVYTSVEAMENWIVSQIKSIRIRKKQCVKTEWSQWQGWSKCTRSCGSGVTFRSRFCINGIAGQSGCIGLARETNACNKSPCAQGAIGGRVPPTQWSDWSACSRTCGGGIRSRGKVCPRSLICDNNNQTQECNVEPCPAWTDWKYGLCDKTCGGGIMVGTRECLNGRHGQAGCEGKLTHTTICNQQLCPIVELWNDWGECSTSCDEGTQTQSCSNCNKTRTRPCNLQKCAKWGPWHGWSDCAVTCGTGRQHSRRDCLFGMIGEGGCVGERIRYQNCNAGPCPIWSSWSNYNPCSRTCGIGEQTATRVCLNGNNCVGLKSRKRQCSLASCTGASFSNWSDWGECSKSCNSGVRRRTRVCSSHHCEADAYGKDNEMFEKCNEEKCEVPFTNWSTWSNCTSLCGGGEQTRTRQCPANETCASDIYGTKTLDKRSCNSYKCPEWSEWVDEGPCSKQCGFGQIKKIRRCNGERLGHPGCAGEAHKFVGCNIKSCASWADWGTWSTCSELCGKANRTRERFCIGASAGDEGCIGETKEVMSCELQPCEDQCSVECQVLVNQYYCFSPTIMNAWFDCHSSCCECRDDPTAACGDSDYGFWNCPNYKCKKTCGLCKQPIT